MTAQKSAEVVAAEEVDQDQEIEEIDLIDRRLILLGLKGDASTVEAKAIELLTAGKADEVATEEMTEDVIEETADHTPGAVPAMDEDTEEIPETDQEEEVDDLEEADRTHETEEEVTEEDHHQAQEEGIADPDLDHQKMIEELREDRLLMIAEEDRILQDQNVLVDLQLDDQLNDHNKDQ